MTKEALAQPEQKSVSMADYMALTEKYVALKSAVLAEREACAEIAEKQRYAIHISLTSNPVQNGTAVGIANAIRARDNTHPIAHKTWVGLTDEELADLSASGLALWELWRAIESKLKEKNELR